jgi:ribokinase
MTLTTLRVPRPGETVTGQSLTYAPGGKGANQAVAAARLGGSVQLVTCVGADAAGNVVRDNLEAHGVGTRYVRTADGVPQGVAVILLDADAQNYIVLAEGSNAMVSPADVDDAAPAFAEASVLLLQNEIRLPTTLRAAQRAREAGVTVVWNPAPAPDALPPEMARFVDILLVNETEASTLSGVPVAGADDALRAAGELRAAGFGAVVVTLGERGALWADESGDWSVPGVTVKAVDTTGAGDTFAGAMAVALAEGMRPLETLEFANAAAALSVTRAGAQGGMPARADLPPPR